MDYRSRSQNLIRIHHPKVVVFVYKGVLDNIIRLQFESAKATAYGFNQYLESDFGTRVFAFPLPGTPCTTEQASIAMRELSTSFCKNEVTTKPTRLCSYRLRPN